MALSTQKRVPNQRAASVYPIFFTVCKEKSLESMLFLGKTNDPTPQKKGIATISGTMEGGLVEIGARWLLSALWPTRILATT